MLITKYEHKKNVTSARLNFYFSSFIFNSFGVDSALISYFYSYWTPSELIPAPSHTFIHIQLFWSCYLSAHLLLLILNSFGVESISISCSLFIFNSFGVDFDLFYSFYSYWTPSEFYGAFLQKIPKGFNMSN